MEEGILDLNLGNLDILVMEDAFRHKAFNTITPNQTQTLTIVLDRAVLGIEGGVLTNGKKKMKEDKKRGIKTYLERIFLVGHSVVDSRQYAQLT